MENRLADHSPNDIENPSTSSELELLKQELESLSDHPLSSDCCIYRVPKRLRVVNEKAYTPQIVSIGPFHHGNEGLKAMEEHKKRYLCDYLKRTKVDLEYYINIIRKKEKELRRCYAEPIGFSSDEFVKIVLVDAAFIIEVLLKYCFEELQDEHDRIFKKLPFFIIWADVQLLENQLPFFILEDLFDSERISVPSSNGGRLSINKLLQLFFRKVKGFEEIKDNVEGKSSSRVEHFVDFLRNFYDPSEQKSEKRKVQILNIPSVTELHQAGVKFKASSSNNLPDIHFFNNKGILEIPKLKINDATEIIIRNLLAFEQCHHRKRCVTDYVVILDGLVNTPEDVDLLVKYGIVENGLGDSSQVATLINTLCNGVSWNRNDFHFTGILEELRLYCGTSWHKWKATLKQKYFNTPWAILSMIAAAVLIILTIIQTVCSIISVTV